jgi:general secretion pathway protein K
MPLTPIQRGRRGVVLLVVLFFALLLTSSIATFVRRSTIDALIARNRDAASEAEALVRGGARLAMALLIEDRLQELTGGIPAGETDGDIWRRASEFPIETPSGATLRLTISDSGSRLNLNALFGSEEEGLLEARDKTPAFLEALLEKVIEDLPVPAAEKNYEPAELAASLIDYIDADDLTDKGEPEDDAYLRLVPPYRPANRPLLSIEELRLVQGFDARLAQALAQYLTVYPFAPQGCGKPAEGCGINLNTAPPHVLALLWSNDGVEDRLADEDQVRRILKARADGGVICGEGLSLKECTPIKDIVPNPIFPPPTYASQIFEIRAEATVGDVRRTGLAVMDRTAPNFPVWLSWRMR